MRHLAVAMAAAGALLVAGCSGGASTSPAATTTQPTTTTLAPPITATPEVVTTTPESVTMAPLTTTATPEVIVTTPRAAPTTRAPAPATATRTTPRATLPSCPPGTVFSPMGVEPCQTPAEVAKIARGEALCGGGHGPVDVCGPKLSIPPGYTPVPSGQPDNRPGYQRCGVRCGEAPTSGDIQGQYAKDQCAKGIKSFC